MDRIVIIGCSGSGKSHLAPELGALLDIPATHLDTRYYDADWTPPQPPDLPDRRRGIPHRALPRALMRGSLDQLHATH